MLALTLLLRNWRSGELKLLSVSIVLAVAVLSGISLFTDRLESTLLTQSNSFLGADNIIKSSRPFNQDWIAAATSGTISQAEVIELRSMVYAGDDMHLAGIKAVTGNYPLRGQLEISQLAFAINPADIKVADGVPARGEVWVDSRLLAMLKIALGDILAVGELNLKVTQLLIREPGTNPLFDTMAPRVLMNIADIPATQVIQLGSDIKYSWLLASDSDPALEKFIAWLKPQLSKHERIEDIASSQERLGNTLKSAKNFLLLAAVIAVLLAGVAIAIAARQFSERHTNQVALMKSLGASSSKIRGLYFSQLLVLGTLASLLGLVVGYGLQLLIATGLQSSFQLTLKAAHWYTYGLSFASGLICLTFFALPALWFLPAIPPLKILRRELAVNSVQVWLQAALAFFAVIFLVAVFSRDLKLTLGIAAALTVVILVSGIFASALFMFSKKMVLRLGGFWRLAFASLQRRKGQSQLQIMVFAIAIMLLLTLSIVRTSLLDDWQRQLPVNAPNHSLYNIPPAALADVKAILQQQQIQDAAIYPTVLGRLVAIKGEAPSEALVETSGTLRRELGLTQAVALASDNKIIAGQWWDQRKNNQDQKAQDQKIELPGVSVEEGTAKNLNLQVGDQLQFSLGGLLLDVQVASIRSVDWKSMRSNFLFIFEPGTLDSYFPNFMTTVYLPAEQKTLIRPLLRQHPTIVVVEFEQILQQMRNIINQVSDGIQWVLLLTLAAGSLVLFAAVMSSIDGRKQEAGLLRALGCSRKLVLGSVFAEFIMVGVLAGIIAIIGAEILLLSLQKFIFRSELQPHYLYWLISPIASAIFISALGVACCRHVVTTPPAVVLREAA